MIFSGAAMPTITGASEPAWQAYSLLEQSPPKCLHQGRSHGSGHTSVNYFVVPVSTFSLEKQLR